MHKNITFEFRDKGWLYQKYVVESLTGCQIAKLCCCHPRTIYQRLINFGIPRRRDGWRWENLKLWRMQNPDWIKHSRKKRRSPSDETKRKLSLIRQGKGNGNWKGGITAKIKGIRRSPQYYQWRKMVLLKYNGICQRCGSTKAPQAHHKLCIIDFPNLIFDIENGEVLCKDCHKQLNFHR